MKGMFDNSTNDLQRYTTGANQTTNDGPLITLSKEGLNIILILNHVVLSGTVSFLGIIANIINIIIFFKQGLGDTINISLFAISVADICGLVTLEWVNINVNPFMDKPELPYEPVDVQYLTGGWPHASFARITIWLTIYVTAERFCCIAFPIKFKQIITPTRTKVIVCVIYVLLLASLLPEYIGLYFGDKFIPARNETRTGLVKRYFTVDLEEIAFLTHAVILFVSFFILVLFTGLLVLNLQRRSTRRSKSTFDKEQSSSFARKDRRTMKMVSLIAIVLIVCCTPAAINYIVMFLVPGFSLLGVHANFFHTSWSVSFLAEAVNSSVNIILFYNLSSKYRRSFQELFAGCKCCCLCRVLGK